MYSTQILENSNILIDEKSDSDDSDDTESVDYRLLIYF
jgi:hypothetical protein